MIKEKEIIPSKAAKDMHIPRTRFTEMKKGIKGISHDTAFHLQVYLGMNAQILMKLQAKYEYSLSFHQPYEEIQSGVVPAAS